jgi:hypothetical protein
MRPTTAMLWPIFFISLLSEDFPSRTQKLKAIAAFLAASAIAAAWPLYVLAKASDAAYINLIVIPLLNGEFLNKIGMTFNKPALALNVLFTPAYFLLTLLFLISSLSVLARFRSRFTRQYAITSCIAVAFIVIAFVPPTIWLQYFAPPVAFMIISICFAANAISSDRPGSGRLVRIFAIVVIIITAVYNDTPVKYISAAFNSKQWVPVKFHKQAADIASLAGSQKLTLTLAPLAALESGNTIYPGLAAGPFAYRVADFLTPPQRKAANVFGPSDVPSLVADRPPSIVILADEKPESLEKPLSDSAPGWNARFLSEPLSLTVLYKSAE